MSESSLSTVINSQVKKAAQVFCKEHGLKLRYLVEKSLLEYMEDTADLQLCRKRQSEENISLKELLQGI